MLAATYTPWVLKNRWLTLIASGAGFGAMVPGTGYVLAGSCSPGGLDDVNQGDWPVRLQ